jgi:hypothetical protein
VPAARKATVPGKRTLFIVLDLLRRRLHHPVGDGYDARTAVKRAPAFGQERQPPGKEGAAGSRVSVDRSAFMLSVRTHAPTRARLTRLAGRGNAVCVFDACATIRGEEFRVHPREEQQVQERRRRPFPFRRGWCRADGTVVATGVTIGLRRKVRVATLAARFELDEPEVELVSRPSSCQG